MFGGNYFGLPYLAHGYAGLLGIVVKTFVVQARVFAFKVQARVFAFKAPTP